MLDSAHRRARSGVGDVVTRGRMLGPRMFPGDVELGKKDDDHKPGKAPLWKIWRGLGLRYRKRRVVITVVLCGLIWLFIQNIPTDLGEKMGRNGYPVNAHPFGQPRGPIPYPTESSSLPTEPKGPPPGPKPKALGEEAPNHYYNGPIKFYRLAPSLHSASTTMGYRFSNRNVVFMAANLKSASTMISMACEMAKWDRNYVHVVINGRETLSMDDILEINGVDKERCKLFWHDARPDYAQYSSDARTEASVISTTSHVYNFLHPQVFIMDDSLNEESFLTRGLRSKAQMLNIPVIEVPAGGSENFMWMTKLDSGSLRSWHEPSIDILVHVPKGSSGLLLRLIKSLYSTDYSGLKPPRLILDLPPEIDPPVKQYIENLNWPPPSFASMSNPLTNTQLILHHRIPNSRTTAKEAALRVLESFYPTHPTNSHVLVLSAQAQLSPLFYQYLRYTLLEYKYSSYGRELSPHLFGISLETPQTYLNGSTPILLPGLRDMKSPHYQKQSEQTGVSFLWEAPNSNAALYLGPMWKELHSFLTYRIAAEKEEKKKTEKLTSDDSPSWMEYALEFMRARGYHFLYPGLHTGESLVTIHEELHQPPEENVPNASERLQEDGRTEEAPPQMPKDGTLGADPSHQVLLKSQERPVIPATRPLDEILPFNGDLPDLKYLPYLSYNGDSADERSARHTAEKFAKTFRKSVGGCEALPKGLRRKRTEGSAADLFCFGDETEEDYTDENSPIWNPKAQEYRPPLYGNYPPAYEGSKKISGDDMEDHEASTTMSTEQSPTSVPSSRAGTEAVQTTGEV
jgi:hypothetical protein